MTRSTIPFPWYLLIHADDKTPLIASGPEFDLLIVFTDLEFADLYSHRCGSICQILKFSAPDKMIGFLEQLLEAASIAEDRPLNHVTFDPIEPAGDEELKCFEFNELLAALRKATSER